MRDQVPQDLYIQVAGINTRYWEAGNGDSTVVFVHGIGSFIEHWEHNFEALSKHHHVLALDLVGFGLTDKPSVAYSIPYLAEFVHEFMRAKGIERASIVGNSLGGMIAIELYFNHPKIIDKLVLVSGGCFGRKLAFELRLLTVPFIGEKLLQPSREGTHQFLQLMFANPALVTKEMVDTAFARNTQPGSAEAYLVTLRSGASIFGLKRSLVCRTFDNANLIVAPTLIIWGKKDKILPIEHASTARKIMPNANLFVLEDCGHIPQIEYSEKVNEKMLEFLT